jgi:hypothetical protein
VKNDRKRKLAVSGVTQRQTLDHSKGRPRFAVCVLWTIIVQLVPFKVTSFVSFYENRPEVEIGRKRRYVKEVAPQFNRPSLVSYLCSVNIARPALSVWSYTQNCTRSENRRQMATPSGSIFTIRWVDVFCCGVNIPRQAPDIYKLTALLQIARTDQRLESVIGGAT